MGGTRTTPRRIRDRIHRIACRQQPTGSPPRLTAWGVFCKHENQAGLVIPHTTRAHPQPRAFPRSTARPAHTANPPRPRQPSGTEHRNPPIITTPRETYLEPTSTSTRASWGKYEPRNPAPNKNIRGISPESPPKSPHTHESTPTLQSYPQPTGRARSHARAGKTAHRK